MTHEHSDAGESGPMKFQHLLAIQQLLAEFAHRLDMCAGDGVAELFTADGTYVIDGRALSGSDAIDAAYRQRREMQTRTVRHLFMNPRIVSFESDACRHSSVMMLYGADGAPVLPLTTPLAITDVDDDLVLTPAGWKFRRRTLTTVFQGGAKILSPHTAQDTDQSTRNSAPGARNVDAPDRKEETEND